MTPPHEPSTTDETVPSLGGHISALQHHITTANTPGNLDGLLARHILQDTPGIPWHVDPMTGSWLQNNTHRLHDTGPLAVLGYGLSTRPTAVSAELTAAACAGLQRLMHRDPFPGDRLTFLHNISILLGICLAGEALKTGVPEFRPWLQTTLADPRLNPTDRFHELAQHHALATLTGQPVPLGNLTSMTDAAALAMAWWMMDRGTARLTDSIHDARAVQQLVIRAALHTDPSILTVPHAALLLWAIDNVLTSSLDQMILSRSHVGMVLQRFEPAMRRWRWDNEKLQHPIRWEVRSEREVQDILWIMLRSVFDDIVDEDTLPKVGHSSYRADFGLPRLGILIEAKYAYKGTDFKTIETEVMIDSIAYLKNTDRYKELVVFIYDQSASVEHHDLTRRTLLDLPGVSEVIIVSRPGVLPLPERPSTTTKRKRSAT